jgi:hypothetical protein
MKVENLIPYADKGIQYFSRIGCQVKEASCHFHIATVSGKERVHIYARKVIFFPWRLH